jgi:hypoxanthine phosphoribosyltransferase
MPPRHEQVDRSHGVLEIDWPFFGELSRALALKVARAYDPEIVVGIAAAGVIPGATIAAILQRDFHSILISRRFGATATRATPAVLGAAPPAARDRRVLLVDETCGSGETIRLARAALVNAGASEIQTAVAFRTGAFEPDFCALETESAIILPWDREILVAGQLVVNPRYSAMITAESDSAYLEE